jgi:rubrerythrin
VERESEIEQELEEERYNDNSLLKSLSEMGLNQDREIKRTLQIMEQKKYFDILENKTYQPLEVAIKLTTHINEIFPQMPGLNLIVYFNQIIDEVLSNRKTVELAVAQIDKTLQTQGFSKFKTMGKTKHKPKSKTSKAKPSLASMLKKSKRLSSLNRLKKKKAPPPVKPSETAQQPAESIEQKAARIVSDNLGDIVSNDFEGAYSINPDEIGAGVTDPQELADMFVNSDEKKPDTSEPIEDIIQTDIQVDIDDSENSESSDGIDSNAQSYADQLFQTFQPEKQEEDSSEQSDPVSDVASEDDDEFEEEEYIEGEDDEADEMEDDEEDDDEEEDDDVEEDEIDDDDDDEESDDDDDEDDEIKRQIEEMNESLKVKRGIRQKSHEALNCPLCHEETIVELETSSHKTYYSCNNDDCKFISWDKPVDNKCPKCDNLFLIEVENDGKLEYQCPNKNCDYKINKEEVDDETFLTPLTQNNSENPEPEKKKKRKKRVRKVRVRRK